MRDLYRSIDPCVDILQKRHSPPVPVKEELRGQVSGRLRFRIRPYIPIGAVTRLARGEWPDPEIITDDVCRRGGRAFKLGREFHAIEPAFRERGPISWLSRCACAWRQGRRWKESALGFNISALSQGMRK